MQMNKLIYVAAIEEIKHTKYKKDIEPLLRKYVYKLHSLEYYSRDCIIDNYNNIYWFYKLSVLSYNKYHSLSKSKLPDFILNNIKSVEQSLTKHFFTSDKNRLIDIDYDKLMDLFEFNSVLHLSTNYDYFKKFDEIVKDQPIHFIIAWNMMYTNFERYSTTIANQFYLQFYRYKQVNFPNQKRTVLDAFLDNPNSKPHNLTNFDESILLLEQQLTALKSIKKEFNEST